ncbi:MAG: radical SAM protein [Candidatus Aureabacteria bacterium]|nr:radical SAM protein [Candidatus Auribacterota bacterium]
MKILLTNTPWYKDGYYGVRAGSRWPHFEKLPDDPCEERPYIPFPFYMAYAAGLLKEAGHDVSVLDAIALGWKEEKFLKKVQNISPDIVVQEVSTPTIDIDIHYAEKIKEIKKDAVIIFCGPNHLMQNKAFLKSHPFVDIVISGEYEGTLKRLMQEMTKGCPDLKDVKGIFFQDRGSIVQTQAAGLIEDIDSLPWPARELFPMEKYVDAVGGLPLPSLQVWASRGCPFHCNFCLWPQLMYGGRNYRVRDAEEVAREIAYCVKKWDYRSFYFDDDTFNIGKKRILELAEEIKKQNINRPFAVMARADTMDEEQLIALKSAGLYSLKYGVESGEQDIVNNCGKALDLKKVEEMVMLTKKHGIKVHLTFAFGLPGETKETVQKTIDFACHLDPDTVQFSIITPFPGSQYYEELDRKGQIISKDWEDYTGYTKAVIRTDHMTEQDLEEALIKANRTWRSHVHRREKVFQYDDLKQYVKGIEEKEIFVLLSSFEEHMKEIVGLLSQEPKKRQKLMVTQNKAGEAEQIFPGKEKIIVQGNRFNSENLSLGLNRNESFFIIPVNNCDGAGYEEIFAFFRDNFPEKYIGVTEEGNIIKDTRLQTQDPRQESKKDS